MDVLSAIVIAGLLVAMLFWWATAHYWRKQATENNHAALGVACGLSRASQESYEAGVAEGLRQGTGGMYLAALRVGGDDRVLIALRAAGRKLIGTDIPVIPEQSLCEVE